MCDILVTVSPSSPLSLSLHHPQLPPHPSSPVPLSLLFSGPPWSDRWLATLTIVGCGSPCSAKHERHDKLPSSVCFASGPHRSPPRPVVTFCCILYMQIPANQLARRSPSLTAQPIVIKMNWLWSKINISQPAKSPGVNGMQQNKWREKSEVAWFLHPSSHFILYRYFISEGKHTAK